MAPTLPNVLIAGAAKCGTTTLYRYLQQHPQASMCPVKEPHFLISQLFDQLPFAGPGDQRTLASYCRTAEGYAALFAGCRGEVVGEASPGYFTYPEAATAAIARHLPAPPRIVIILRDPAARAYSNYLHKVRDGKEPLPFAQALDAEPRRRAAGWAWGWHYVAEGFYHDRVKHFLEHHAQVLVLLFEDLGRDPAALARRLYRFCGLDEGFTPETAERHNPSGVPRSRLAQRALTSLLPRLPYLARAITGAGLKGPARRLWGRMKRANLRREPMPQAARRRLRQTYAEDVERLQGLLGRDLSHWLTA